jgi:hypothetical protein
MDEGPRMTPLDEATARYKKLAERAIRESQRAGADGEQSSKMNPSGTKGFQAAVTKRRNEIKTKKDEERKLAEEQAKRDAKMK